MPIKLDLEKVRNRIRDRGFEPLFEDKDYKNNNTNLKVKCKCGKIFYPTINNIKKTNSCGYCNDPSINDRFGNLVVNKVISSKYGTGCKVICKCDCGNMRGPDRYSFILNGHIKSCGHCNDPKIGDRFGKLTVIEVFPTYIGDGCQVKCRCDCGMVWGPHRAAYLKSPNSHCARSCGNCKLHRNGRLTSQIALELHGIIEKILNKTCEHNYYIKGRCFDIVCPELKIVIEYDGYYWHRIYRNTTKSEERDERLLKKEEYKFLRIRSSGDDMPTEDQLRKVLTNHFEHDYKKWTITMKSWKNKSEHRRS